MDLAMWCRRSLAVGHQPGHRLPLPPGRGTGQARREDPVGEDPFVVVPPEDCLWIPSEDEGGVLRRVDRATHEVTTVGKFPLVDTAALAFGYLWLSARDGGGVWKLDPSTGEVLDQTTLSRPTGMVEHEDRLWITLEDGSSPRLTVDRSPGREHDASGGRRAEQIAEGREAASAGLRTWR
jgi:streptogramin lyase